MPASTIGVMATGIAGAAPAHALEHPAGGMRNAPGEATPAMLKDICARRI